MRKHRKSTINGCEKGMFFSWPPWSQDWFSALGGSHGAHFHIGGSCCCCLLKQCVCCWDIHHADKPEANTAVIRHLVCCGETSLSGPSVHIQPLHFFNFLFFFLFCFFALQSPATLCLQSANGVPDRRTSTNVSQLSMWWKFSLEQANNL